VRTRAAGGFSGCPGLLLKRRTEGTGVDPGVLQERSAGAFSSPATHTNKRHWNTVELDETA
jgi:hypothetical protein